MKLSNAIKLKQGDTVKARDNTLSSMGIIEGQNYVLASDAEPVHFIHLFNPSSTQRPQGVGLNLINNLGVEVETSYLYFDRK